MTLLIFTSFRAKMWFSFRIGYAKNCEKYKNAMFFVKQIIFCQITHKYIYSEEKHHEISRPPFEGELRS